MNFYSGDSSPKQENEADNATRRRNILNHKPTEKRPKCKVDLPQFLPNNFSFSAN